MSMPVSTSKPEFMSVLAIYSHLVQTGQASCLDVYEHYTDLCAKCPKLYKDTQKVIQELRHATLGNPINDKWWAKLMCNIHPILFANNFAIVQYKLGRPAYTSTKANVTRSDGLVIRELSHIRVKYTIDNDILLRFKEVNNTGAGIAAAEAARPAGGAARPAGGADGSHPSADRKVGFC